MVTPVVDPVRVPSINLTEGELSDIEAMIERGELPKDFLERHYLAVDLNVFGHDAKTDRDGNYIEQGLGSAQNQTMNSIAAYKKYCNPENPKATDPDPNYKENLPRMQAELAECEKARVTTRAKNRAKRRLAGRR
jgi:hypothetical protein